MCSEKNLQLSFHTRNITARVTVPIVAFIFRFAFLLLRPYPFLDHPVITCRNVFLECMPLGRMKSLPIEIVTNQRDAMYAPPQK